MWMMIALFERIKLCVALCIWYFYLKLSYNLLEEEKKIKIRSGYNVGDSQSVN